jgi:hypothetical protein
VTAHSFSVGALRGPYPYVLASDPALFLNIRLLEFPQNVIASEAKQSIIAMKNGLLRRFAPRNDVCLAKFLVNIEIPIRF